MPARHPITLELTDEYAIVRLPKRVALLFTREEYGRARLRGKRALRAAQHHHRADLMRARAESQALDWIDEMATVTLPAVDEAAQTTEQDDIVDPPLPEALKRPPLQAGEQAMLDMAMGAMKGLDLTIQLMDNRLKERIGSIGPAEAGALQHLCEALEALSAKLPALTPYHAAVQAISPQGYVTTISIERTDGAAFLADLVNLHAWLAGQQWRGVEG